MDVETRLQAETGTLKRTDCVAESDCLLWRERVWRFVEIHRLVAHGGGRTGFSREARIGKRKFPRVRHKESFVPDPRGWYPIIFCETSSRVYPRNCNRTHSQYPNAFLQNFKIPLYFVFPAPTFTPVGAGGVSP